MDWSDQGLGPQPDGGIELQAWLDAATDMGQERCDRYATFQNFYDGVQGVKLPDRAKRFLEQSGVPWCENFCEPVVDAMTDKLELSAVRAKDGPDLLNDWLAATFAASRLDAMQTTVYAQALVKGDAFVLLDEVVEGAPRFVWNRSESVRVWKDDAGMVDAAVKVWVTTARGPLNPSGMLVERVNVYWPDRIGKWFRPVTEKRKDESWVPWQDEGERPGGGPWVDDAGVPLGVPVFHFPNRALGRCYGRSELAGVVPQQEALNKLVIDLALAADYYGMPQRWMTGQPEDPALESGAGLVWRFAGVDVELGQFEPADLTHALAATEGALSRLARRSRTPLHLLTGGDMPSGEALRAAESGLVGKVEDRQMVWGDVWEDAFVLAARMAGVPLDPGVVFEAVWEPAATVEESERLNAAMLKRELGVSKTTLLRELGYDPEQERELRELDTEEALRNQQIAFDRGGAPDGDEDADETA